MTRFPRVALAFAASVAVITACSKKPQTAPTPTTNPAQDSIDKARQDSIAREQARQDSIRRAEQARQDSIRRAEQARQDSINAANAAMASARNALTAQVYFEFDQSDLTADATATLDKKLPVLQANPGLRIRIAGNADERGSDEYNLALGQRRAATAKRYLVQHGIDAGRIDLISYGEERAVCQGHDESCWSQNRRDEFEITAGGDTIKAP